MNQHESYEILCALAACGRASADDLEELSLHLQDCRDCRDRLSGFAQLSAQALPLHGEKYARGRVPSGMVARFVERARADGIALRGPSRLLPRVRAVPRVAWSAAAALVVLLGVLAIRDARVAPTLNPKREPTAARVSTPTQDHAIALPVAENPQQVAQLRAQLQAAWEEIDSLQEKIVALHQELTAANAARDDVSSRLATLENDNTDLRLQASSREFRLDDLERQLKQKESMAIDEIANMAEEQAALEKLRNQLSERERELEHERQLLAASAQARDLITARNLHIIDVHDNDRAGRQRPFGRIFYTEGQSLIFYAYDLDPSGRRDTRVAFHVWGGTLADKQRVKNLGVFRSEDSAASRWVLTFDDPRVLAQINTVFVTAESAKNNLDQPKGKRILYAFLGDHPNHP